MGKPRKTLNYEATSIIQYTKTLQRALNDDRNCKEGVLKLGTLTRMNFIEAVRLTLMKLASFPSIVTIKPNEKRTKARIKVNGRPTMFMVHPDEFQRVKDSEIAKVEETILDEMCGA